MAYPEHFLLQFGGTLGTGEGDIWSCGIKLGLYGASFPEGMDEEQYLDDTALPGLAAWMADPNMNISIGAKLTFVKCNAINSLGHYADPGTVHERFGALGSGSSGGDVHPFQVSMVLTWGTDDRVRGPGSTGRIFAPMPVVPISASTGLFSPAGAAAAAQGGADLINSLDAALGVGGVGGVVRPSLVSPSGAGVISQINFVTADNRCDIQRRRANSLEPVRSRVDVTY